MKNLSVSRYIIPPSTPLLLHACRRENEEMQPVAPERTTRWAPSLAGSTFGWINMVLLLLVNFSAVAQDISAVTFSYNGTDGSDGSAQTYTVPSGIYSLSVVAYGAAGRDGFSHAGGKGGKVESRLQVTPGQVLTICVGGTPPEGGMGYNGGGKGLFFHSTIRGGGGGGATDIRINGTDLSDRVIVAGGGGGGGSSRRGGQGGNGGGLTGETAQDASGSGGRGGSQTAGGQGGPGSIKVGNAGVLGNGGDGFLSSGTYITGAGGGGYYGGGSGGDGTDQNGIGGIVTSGGGGSSYTHPTAATGVTHTQGARSGHGEVSIIPIPALSLTTSVTALNCSVPAATLTASGGASYEWSTGATSSGIHVTTAGVYSVTITASNGYSETFSKTITSDKTPPGVSLTANNVIDCHTNSVTITATPITGAAYSFSPGATQTGNGNTATVTQAGTYSVAVTGTNGCQTVTSVTVNENKTPPVVSLNSSGAIDCQNTGVTLTATQISGATYAFSAGATQAGNGNTATVTQPGTYSVTVTGTNGCSFSTSVYVPGTAVGTATLNQPASHTVCIGTTSPIAFSGNANTYTWTNSNPGIGLPAGGISTTGLPPFTAVNSTNELQTASITVTPLQVPVVYVANGAGNSLDLINTLTNTVMASIPVGNNPQGVSVSPDGSRVYVANYGSNTVSVVNTATRTVLATIPVGIGPAGTLLSPDGGRLYVSIRSIGRVNVINTATNTVLAEISVGNEPEGMTISPDGSKLYVAVRNNDKVSVINTAANTVTAQISVGNGPSDVAVSPDGSRLYVTNASWGNVNVISTATNTVTGTVTVGTLPMGVSLSADGSKVYVANYVSGNVSVINTADHTVASTISLGGNPLHINTSADGSRVYVVNASGSVSIVDAGSNSVLNTVSVGGYLSALGNFVSNAGCPGESKMFTVSVQPAVELKSSGSLTCTNQSVTLTATSIAGATYAFSNGAAQVNGGNTAIVSQPGTYSVMVTSPDGCTSEASVSVTLSGSVIYVRQGSSGNGASWDCALGDLQSAINLAASGQQVWVAAGEYKPVSSGHSFSMKEGVKIYGGFAAAGSPAFGDRNWVQHVTTLKGNGNSVVVNDANGLTNAALLDGFTITGGSAVYGGGMLNIDAFPLINHCIFTANRVTSWGGGIYNQGSGTATIVNSLFHQNSAQSGGAAFSYQNAKPRFANVTLVDNNADENGGAVHNYEGAETELTNCIVWSNTQLASSSQLFTVGPGKTKAYFSVLEGGEQAIIGGKETVDIIPQNPLFTDAANGDFTLQGCSPALNIGTGSVLSGFTSDLAGNARLVGIADAGAYEYQAEALTGADRLAVNGHTAAVQAMAGQTYLVRVPGDDCRSVAALTSNGTSPVSGEITITTYVDNTVQTFNGSPYVQRHYDISPVNDASTTTAHVTLYFTREEFAAYNTSVGRNDLPVWHTDNRSGLRVFQYHGNPKEGQTGPGAYSGAPVALIPDLTWNFALERWEVGFNVTGFSGFFVGSADAALPVRLVSFEGRPTENGTATLQWRVTGQEDMAAYTVEHSDNGINFTAIGAVSANVSSESSYRFTDTRPHPGVVAYYRLKMTEMDGSHTYSRIISVVLAGDTDNLTAYPVPAGNFVSVRGKGVAAGSLLRLINAQGIVLKLIHVVSDGQQIDISGIPAGVYFIGTPSGSALKVVKE